MTVEYSSGSGRAWLETHEYVCDRHQLEHLMQAQAGNRPIAVLGWIANQTEWLDLFDTIILLSVDPQILAQRLRTRTSNDFARDPSELAFVLDSKEPFERSMIKNGAIVVDASQPIEGVVIDILTASHPPPHR